MIDHKSKVLSDYILAGKKIPDNVLVGLIPWAENNRMLYKVAEQNHELKNMKTIGNEWLEKLANTLLEIKQTLTQDEYVVTRTYKYVDYVTFDVDLFVDGNSFQEVVKKFKTRGFNIESHDASLGGRLPGMQVNIKKQGLLTIDLHQDFTWQKRQFLDPKLVMKDSVKRDIAGKIVLAPRPEIELLLCIADIAHERFNITLLDLIWLEGLSKEIKDWDFVLGQTREYKWENIFKKVSSIINQMSLDIYGHTIIYNIQPKKGNYKLPYFLDLFTCWGIYQNTMFGYFRFPFTSFLYMHYNQLRYYITNQMPYYSPWYKN